MPAPSAAPAQGLRPSSQCFKSGTGCFVPSPCHAGVWEKTPPLQLDLAGPGLLQPLCQAGGCEQEARSSGHCLMLHWDGMI